MRVWMRGIVSREARILVLPIERDDLEARVRWLNDPEVQETLSFDAPVSLSRTVRWFERAILDPNRRDFTIWQREPRRRIGMAGLLGIDYRSRKAEVYVTIGEKECWGQGFATEAYEWIETYAFEELGLERLFLYTLAENSGTQRIMEKLQWKREGCLRRDAWSHGETKDRIVYGLLRSEWLRRNGWEALAQRR